MPRRFRYYRLASRSPQSFVSVLFPYLRCGVHNTGYGQKLICPTEAEYALGIHIWLTRPEGNLAQLKVRQASPLPHSFQHHLTSDFQAFLATTVIYNASQIITKISFLLQYRRIFTEGRTRVVCFWFLVFLILWGLVNEVLAVLGCVPLMYIVPSMKGKCLDVLLTFYLTSIMNIVTDFLVFILPVPAVRKLALPRNQKIIVISIFGLGFL